MLHTSFGSFVMESTQLLIDFFFSWNVATLWWKTVSIQAIAPHVAQIKMWRSLQNCQPRPVIHWQVRTPVWNMPLNSKGGLEHVALVSVEFVPLFIYAAFPMQVSKNITMILHPYSPDWSIMLSLVSKNKLAAVRATFPGCSWKLWTVADCVPHTVPKSQFHWCFQQLQKYWAHCINLEGD